MDKQLTVALMTGHLNSSEKVVSGTVCLTKKGWEQLA